MTRISADTPPQPPSRATARQEGLKLKSRAKGPCESGFTWSVTETADFKNYERQVEIAFAKAETHQDEA